MFGCCTYFCRITYYGESELGRHYVNAPIHIVDNGDGTYGIDGNYGWISIPWPECQFGTTYDLNAGPLLS